MKKYQTPKIEVVAFDAKDVITVDFSSFDLGEWADKKGNNTNTIGSNWG